MFIDQIKVVEKEGQHEKRVEKAIQRWLKKNLNSGEYVYYKNWGGGFGRAGRPDIEIVYRGKVNYWELKDPQGRLSTLQVAVIDSYKKAGVDILVADSLEKFIEQWYNIYEI